MTLASFVVSSCLLLYFVAEVNKFPNIFVTLHTKACETAHVDFVDLCRDSTIQASLMVLTAPSVRPSMRASWLSFNRSFVALNHQTTYNYERKTETSGIAA
jgi:hypothetical protein